MRDCTHEHDACRILADVITSNSMLYQCDNRDTFMNISKDIHPLTDFKRNTSDFLARLKESGHPLVLTINGKAELVVQDAKSYQRLLDIAERLETIQAVKEGIASMQRGEGQPVEAFFNDLEAELRAASRP